MLSQAGHFEIFSSVKLSSCSFTAISPVTFSRPGSCTSKALQPVCASAFLLKFTCCGLLDDKLKAFVFKILLLHLCHTLVLVHTLRLFSLVFCQNPTKFTRAVCPAAMAHFHVLLQESQDNLINKTLALLHHESPVLLEALFEE